VYVEAAWAVNELLNRAFQIKGEYYFLFYVTVIMRCRS
jgi:hypothetical protein